MRILGVDIGAKSIKAVEVDSAFGRFEIHEYHERKLEPGANPFGVVEQLIASLAKAPDKIVTGLSSQKVTLRNLHLPTRDKRAIQASVSFELEDDLPFAAEDGVHDSIVTSQVGQLSNVHVAATLRKLVLARIQEWKDAGIDPDVLTTEAWAYRTLLNRLSAADQTARGKNAPPAPEEPPTLIVQAGHERTTLYLHFRGNPIFCRDLRIGGRDLTQAVSAKYGVPLEQAETAKIDSGFVLPHSQRAQASAEQIEFSDLMMSVLDELFREIRQALLACKSSTQEPLGRIYLAGGTSQLPGLSRLIEEEFRIPTLALQSLSKVAASGVTYSESTDANFALAGALALCLVGTKNHPINFRKGALSKQGSKPGIPFEIIKGPALALLLIFICFSISMSVQRSAYEKRITEANSKLEKSVQSFFGGAMAKPQIKSFLANTDKLSKAVKGEVAKQHEQAKLMGQNPHSPLDLLKTLSMTVPRDVVVDMIQYQAGASPTDRYSTTAPTTASLTFTVANPQMIEKLGPLIDRRLPGATKSQVEEVPAPDGGAKKYKITFSGKPSEDAYGN